MSHDRKWARSEREREREGKTQVDDKHAPYLGIGMEYEFKVIWGELEEKVWRLAQSFQNI